MQLILAHSGWLLIDQETLRVRGRLDSVVRRMQELMNRDEVRQLCEYLGITSAGFLFHDAINDLTKFFTDKGPSPTYQTPYIWTSPDKQARWSDVVHTLFVRTREAQQQYAKQCNSRTEDYFVHVPHAPLEDVWLSEQERQFRQELGLHYCTLGEMLFTILLWRVLRALKESGRGAVELAAGICGLDEECDARPYRWLGRNLTEALDGSDNLRSRPDWPMAIEPSGTIRRDFYSLGVSVDSKASASLMSRTALLRFIDAMRGEGVHGPSDATDGELLDLLIEAAPCFMSRFRPSGANASVEGCLEMLERCARFPVPAFYAWQLLDEVPLSYLVSPVWTSQKYKVTTERGTCYHLGLALCAVRPLSTIDWTISTEHREQSMVSKADPVVIANVLKLMARPLVEGALYDTGVSAAIARIAGDALQAAMTDDDDTESQYGSEDDV